MTRLALKEANKLNYHDPETYNEPNFFAHRVGRNGCGVKPA